MRPLRHRTLQTRVIRIAREERDQLRLAREPRIVGVEIAQGLEAGDTAHGLGGAASNDCLLLTITFFSEEVGVSQGLWRGG